MAACDALHGTRRNVSATVDTPYPTHRALSPRRRFSPPPTSASWSYQSTLGCRPPASCSSESRPRREDRHQYNHADAHAWVTEARGVFGMRWCGTVVWQQHHPSSTHLSGLGADSHRSLTPSTLRSHYLREKFALERYRILCVGKRASAALEFAPVPRKFHRKLH